MVRNYLRYSCCQHCPFWYNPNQQWVQDTLAAVSHFARQRNLEFGVRKPDLKAFSLNPTNFPTMAYNLSKNSKLTMLDSGLRAFVFGDFTHASALTQLLSVEFGIDVIGAGTFNLKLRDEFEKAVAPYTAITIVTTELEEVHKQVADLMPDLIVDSQLERGFAALLNLPFALVSSPLHFTDFPLGYQPFLGYDGAYLIADRLNAALLPISTSNSNFCIANNNEVKSSLKETIDAEVETTP